MKKQNIEDAPTSWHVEMFNGLQVIHENETIKQFRTRRAALVIVSLALKPGTARTRGQLGEMLWPEAEPSLQRNRLRFELSTLRSTLGISLFATDSGTDDIALSSTVTSDVARFDALVAQSKHAHAPERRIDLLRQVVALYKGDLLPGLDLPAGCLPEQDWLSLERNRLREVALSTAKKLVQDLSVLGLYEEVAQRRQNLSTIFPEADEFKSGYVFGKPQTAAIPQQPGWYNIASPPSYPPTVSMQGSFVGRAKEMSLLQNWARNYCAAAPPQQTRQKSRASNANLLPQLLPEHRLITILGMGGIGKTRLIIEAFKGHSNTVFVPLATISDKDDVYESVASVLSLPQRPHVPTRNKVIEALRARPGYILLFDNCEHVSTACTNCVADLLSECSDLRIVATSQHALMLDDEQRLTLHPLSSQNALALFLERARTVQTAFAGAASAFADATVLIDLLEGVPLALELAAARATVLGPGQMLTQLRKQLNFLATANPSRPDRHRSIRAVLQWTADLLSDDARRLLTFLSLFRTSASLEAIEAVASEVSNVLNSLEELRLYSLLVVSFQEAEDGNSTARYDLLFCVRRFSSERIEEQDRRNGWERHGDYWAQQVALVPNAFHWGQWKTIQALLIPDLDNIRAAIAGCIELGLAKTLYALADALGTVFLEMGYWEDADTLLRSADKTAQLTPLQSVRLLGLQGALDRRRGNEENACLVWKRNLALARQIDDADLEATILFDLAGQAIDRHQLFEAQVLIDEGMTAANRSPMKYRLVVGSVLTARLLLAQKHPVCALEQARSSWQALLQLTVNPSQTLYVLVHLLPLFRVCDDCALSEELISKGIPLAIETGQAFILARLLDEASLFWEAHQEYALAELGFFIAFSIHVELGSRFVENARSAWEKFRTQNKYAAGCGVVDEEPYASSASRTQSWQDAVEKLRFLCR